MNKQSNILISGIVVFLLVGGSFGQMQVGTQGRALDASSQAGSGGYNSRVPSSYTKNTHMSSLTESRGLSGFRGHVPTLSSSLRVGDSTNGVSRFIRQSVGVSTLRSPQKLYDPKDTYYIDPLRATLRTGQILKAEGQGTLALPGKPVPRSSSAMDKMYVNAMAEYAPIMPRAGALASSGQALTTREIRPSPGLRSYQRPGSELAKKVELEHVIRRGGDSMYGVLKSGDRRDIAAAIRDFDKDLPAYNQPKRPLDTLQDPMVDDESKRGQPIDGRERLDPKPGAWDGLEGRRVVASQTNNWRTMPAANQDSYVDLLMMLKQKRDAEQQKKDMGIKDPTRKNKPASPPLPEDADDIDAALDATPMRRAYKSRNVELTKNNRIIIHKLTGKPVGVFSQYMTLGKESLSKGLYYQAARQYDLATIAKSQNPMPYLGGCLAYFGSGEWESSAKKLTTALKIFPPLVETHIDLPEFLSNDDIKANFAELENAIQAGNEKPTLILLATYISYNLGDKINAQKYATMLKAEKSVPPVYHTLADYVLTGKLPSETAKDKKGK